MSKAEMKVENEILGQIIRDFTDEGYGVEIEEDSAIFYIRAVNTEKDKDAEDRYFGWVKFVWGNGADCLSDYTTNLEKIITPSLEMQKHMMD